MRYLFSKWKEVAARLKSARHRLYLFDVDGTLASIEKVPDAARIREPLLRLLYSLSVQPRSTVGIISGRQLDNAKAMVGLEHLIYAGNHGLEVCFNGIRHVQPAARAHARSLEEIYQKVEKLFSAVPGAITEWKGLTMSLHYRLVNKRNKAKFDGLVQQLIPLLGQKGFKVRHGKKVVEILPAGNTSKGTVVQLLKTHFRTPTVVFVGDDVTDEDAFAVLEPDDVSIRIGHNDHSKASYYLKNQSEVKNLLRRLVTL